jgi:hypothetical protein
VDGRHRFGDGTNWLALNILNHVARAKSGSVRGGIDFHPHDYGAPKVWRKVEALSQVRTDISHCSAQQEIAPTRGRFFIRRDPTGRR